MLPQDIRPVGFNLGGWLSQSPLTDEHSRTFIQKKDFQAIAGWGFNSVRLPVDAPWLFEKEGRGKISKKRLEFLKQVLKWAKDAGLLTILDLHQTPCHSFAKPELENLWKNEEDLDSFCESWMELAHALKRTQAPLWFDILNEPTALDSQDWNHAVARIFRALRMADPKRVLVIEPTFWASVLRLHDLVDAIQGPNLVYSFHFYLPMLVTHQQAPWWKEGQSYVEKVEYPGPIPRMRDYLAKDLAPNVRKIFEYENRTWNKETLREVLKPVEQFSKQGFHLHCGEFGVYERAPRLARLNWTRDVVGILRDLNVGWAYWNYKWLDFGVWPKAGDKETGPLDQQMLDVLKAGI